MPVGWAKARLRRAHRHSSKYTQGGGHASLSPPHTPMGLEQRLRVVAAAAIVTAVVVVEIVGVGGHVVALIII